MIVTMLPPMTSAVIRQSSKAQSPCNDDDEEMYNNRYYRSFHGVSNVAEKNERAAARLKLTSVLSNKVSDRRTSADNRSISAAAGLLHETRRTNSSPCLDDSLPNNQTTSTSGSDQACPYAISRHRQVCEAIPTMYGTSSPSERQRSISTSSAAIFKNDTHLSATKLNTPASASLNSLNSAKGNKVANLKNKFDLLSEKAKKEEIKISKKSATVEPLQKSSTEKHVNKIGKSSKAHSLLKSSTMPDCSPTPKSSNSKVKNNKISNVKLAVKSFERSISDDVSGDARKALNKSTSDLVDVKSVSKITNSSFSRDNKKYSSTPHNAATKPVSTCLKISQTSHLHSTVRQTEKSKTPAVQKNKEPNVPRKNSSALHQKPILSKKSTPSEKVCATSSDNFKIPAVPPVDSKQRKLLAKSDISRANLGRAPEPPKMSKILRVPVPQPRKCWIDKIEPSYLNKNEIPTTCKTTTELVSKNPSPKHDVATKKDSTEKSKSLPNSSFLWNYRESVSSSNENIESPENSRTDSCEYFEDPYIYEGSIVEYASTTLPVDEEPIYMEANFLDGKRMEDTEQCNGEYACTDVTRLSHEVDAKDSGESDEGWVDLSENEVDKSELNRSGYKTKLRKKNGSKKSNLNRLSWSHSFQKLNKQCLKSPSEECKDANDWEMNDGTSVSSCTDSMDHQYEALYDIINQSSIVADVGDHSSDAGDSIPQLPIRDHSPLPKMKNKALSKDSGIGEYRSQTIDTNYMDDEANVDNSGIAKIAGEKIRRIKRNWSLTKSDIRLELSSRWNRMKPKKTSKSAAEIGVSTFDSKNLDIKIVGTQKCTYSSPLVSPSSPTKETAQFYLTASEVIESTTTKVVERPKSESFTLDCNVLDSARPDRNNRRVSLNRVSRPTVSPPLPPTERRTSTTNSTYRSSTSSSDCKSSVYDSIWWESENKSGQENRVSKSSTEPCIPLKNNHTSANPSSFSSNGINGVSHEKSEMKLNLRGIGHRKLSIEIAPDPADLGIPHSKMPPKSPVNEEPLYQFYQENMRQRTSQWNNASDGSSGSEQDHQPLYEVMDGVVEIPVSETQDHKTNGKKSTIEMMKSEVKLQTLWCDIPEVKASGILNNLSTQERKLQEAIFEIMTSEASYLKSLDILINHFMSCAEFVDEFSTECVLSRHERHVLFSDVLPVYEVSKRLLAAFEKHWQENIKLPNICDILYEHASKYFSVYVKYCSNQIYQDRQYKELKENKPEFIEVIKKLESSPVCQSLSMHSFLMLPMQRITRLPLLVDAVYHRLDAHTYLYDSSKNTLACLNKIVADCNEGARKMERMEEMLRLSQQIDFKDCKGIPLISSNRWLVKKGELTKLNFSETSTKLSFGKATKCSKINVYLFLFTDWLIITKTKGDGSYNVIDYCPRNMVQVAAINDENTLKLPCRPPDGANNLFQFTMLQNHEGKTVELIFCCDLESTRMRWMEAVTPPTSENPDEKIYEEWDCPQVQVVHSYHAQQPDELTLEESDVVNVFRKMADGWYQGERIRDGVQGWFPANHTEEIVSSHVRARNLRQRYRLLALSHSYLLQAQKSRSK